jgi:hypothetical protein
MVQGNFWDSMKNTWSAISSNVVSSAAKYIPNPVMVTPVAALQTSTTLTVGGAQVLQQTTTVTVNRLTPMLPVGSIVRSGVNAVNYFNVPKYFYDGAAAIGSAIACGPGGGWRTMAASPISVAVGMGMTVLALRAIWKLQHRLDLRGYLLQAGAFLFALVATLAGYYLPGPIGVVLFDSGVILMFLFLSAPDVIYYGLRFYDHRWGAQKGSA